MNHEPRCTGTKVCRTCKQERHALAFAANPYMTDGLQLDCRHCVSAAKHEAERRLHDWQPPLKMHFLRVHSE